MKETNERVKLLKQLIKDELVDEQVRIQIQPWFSYSDENMKMACKKYNISEEEFRDIIKVESFRSELDTPFKESFGFYKFSSIFDDLAFVFYDGKIIEVNPGNMLEGMLWGNKNVSK